LRRSADVKRIFIDNEKKDARRPYLPGVLIVFLLLALPVISSDQNPRRMVIQIKECFVRSGPSFFAGESGKLEYNDPIQVLEEKGAWTKVTAERKKISGWLHSTAIIPPSVAISDGSVLPADKNAGSGEVVTAGRSIFSDDTEAAVTCQVPGLEFRSRQQNGKSQDQERQDG
jgi:hypothetical protein